jgi:hypothetical protein
MFLSRCSESTIRSSSFGFMLASLSIPWAGRRAAAADTRPGRRPTRAGPQHDINHAGHVSFAHYASAAEAQAERPSNVQAASKTAQTLENRFGYTT